MKMSQALVVLAATMWTVPSYAQEDAAKPGAQAATPAEVSTTGPVPPAPVLEQKFGREMGGHFFMPSHLIDDPFSYTAFGMAFGLGSGNALGPNIQLQPPEILPGSKWYGYTGLGVGFLQNIRFLEYLSARIAVS